jgi:hypothetical protein
VKDLAAMTGTATAMTPNDGNTSKHAFAPSVPFHRLGDTTANVTLAVQSHNFSLWRAEVASAISVHDFYVSVGAGSQTAVLVHNCDTDIGGNAAEFSNDELAQAAFQHSGEGDVEGIARPSIDEISDAIENGARTRIRDDAVQMVQNNVKVIINETSPFRSTAYYLGSQ